MVELSIVFIGSSTIFAKSSTTLWLARQKTFKTTGFTRGYSDSTTLWLQNAKIVKDPIYFTECNLVDWMEYF